MSRQVVPMSPHAVAELFVEQGSGKTRTETGSRRYDSWEASTPVVRASVELTTDKSSQATLTVLDEGFSFTDRHLAGDGYRKLTARLWLGFERNLRQALFKGRLMEAESDGREATLTFHDLSADLKREAKTRYHSRLSDLGILRKIAADNGKEFSGPDSADDGEEHEAVIQPGITDWQFARKVARRAGYVIWVEGDTFFCKPAAGYGEPVTSLEWGRDFRMLAGGRLGYKLPESQRGKHRRVEYRARASDGGRLVGKSDESGRGQSHVEVREDLPTHTAKAARHRARARKDSRREHAFEHSIRLLPVYAGPPLRLRDTLSVVGAGRFFSGKHIVGRVRYQFGAGELVQELSIYRDI
jgi:hypothetical protein